MNFNIGIADRVIRILLGTVGLYATYRTGNYLWIIFGGVLILTAVVGFCPIYGLFGLKTLGKHKDHSDRPPTDETLI